MNNAAINICVIFNGQKRLFAAVPNQFKGRKKIVFSTNGPEGTGYL